MNIFINPTEHRLRSGWRLLIHSILVFLFTFVIGTGLVIVSSFLKLINLQSISENPLASNSLLTLSSEFAFACGVTLATLIARRWLDRRSFRSLGFYFKWGGLGEIMVGFLVAGLMMGLIFGIEWGLGWVEFSGFGWQFEDFDTFFINCIVVLILFILVGWTEELLSRGYHLQNLSEGLNRTWGIGLTALIFALLHISNPGYSFEAFIGLFISGVFFCYAYFQRGNLWLPIGLHIGWNFFEGTVFGFQVSGLTNMPTIIRQSTSGISWVTGGEFGPEAGLILLPGIILGVILVWIWGRLKPLEQEI